MKTQNTQLKPAGPRIASTSAGLLIRSNTYLAAVLALFFSGATLLTTSATWADTITVINTNDSGPGSLRQALVNVNDGDTINFDSSLNGQRITLTSGQLNVNKDVTISGPGAKNLAVDGNAQSRVFYVNPGKTVTIDGLSIANGHAVFSYGGGIYNEDAALTVTNCVLSGNDAYSGGGIRNQSVNSGATLTVTNSTISGNSATGGGGISNLADGGDATLTVTNSTISGNSGYIDGGGGIANYVVSGATATLMITNSTISGNSASFAGGIYNSANGSATLTITNSTISNNSAGGDGGGIFNEALGGSATLTLTNSTISSNSAGDGGGIFNYAYVASVAVLTVSNSTISGNSGGYGGGIFNTCLNASATLTIGDTILNAGDSGKNIYNQYNGTVTSLGYNLSSDNGGGYLTGPSDQTNTDPLLGPLQDNGGPTFTHALLPGSPAIDTGDPNFTPPPFYDQRGPGFDRIANGRIDVGSFEVQGPRPTPTPRPSPTPRHRPTPFPRQ